MSMRRPVTDLLSRCVAMALAAAAPLAPGVAAASTIIVVVADDLDTRTLDESPALLAIAERGLRFDQAIAPSPLCAPARASILSGLYAHNHGVRDNQGTVQLSASTLPDWFHAAGWRTVGAGKFANGLSRVGAWDRWIRDRNRRTGFTRDGEYWLDDLTDRTIAALDAEPGRDTLLYFAPSTPHGPFRASAEFAGTDFGPVAILPSINDPSPYDSRARWIAAADLDAIATRQRTRREMTRSLAQSIERLLAARPDAVLVFISDNGFFAHGAHQRSGGKGSWYDEALRVPMFIVGPGIAPGRTDALVVNHDVAATAADLAGISTPELDGRSVFSAATRRRVLIDHDAEHGGQWAGVRTLTRTYVEHLGGRELYRRDVDPWELAPTDNGDTLAAWLPAVRTCRGAQCWEVER